MSSANPGAASPGQAFAISNSTALSVIVLVIAATACFATLDTVTKHIAISVPLLMAIWLRYAFQAEATTMVALPVRELTVLRTGYPSFHVLRGLLLLSTSVLAFVSLKFMPVGEFTAIVMIAPLVITLLAATSLGETVSPLRWALVIGGFTGTVVIIRPMGDSFQWPSLLPLGLIVTNSWSHVLTSKLARTEDPVTMHVCTGCTGTIAASLALLFVWTAMPDWSLWEWLCVMGSMAAMGYFILILAYKRAPIATLTP